MEPKEAAKIMKHSVSNDDFFKDLLDDGIVIFKEKPTRISLAVNRSELDTLIGPAKKPFKSWIHHNLRDGAKGSEKPLIWLDHDRLTTGSLRFSGKTFDKYLLQRYRHYQSYLEACNERDHKTQECFKVLWSRLQSLDKSDVENIIQCWTTHVKEFFGFQQLTHFFPED